MLVELQHALVQGLPSKMLGHHVGWVLGSQNLKQLELSGVLFFLDAKAAHIYVLEFAGTFAFRDG